MTAPSGGAAVRLVAKPRIAVACPSADVRRRRFQVGRRLPELLDHKPANISIEAALPAAQVAAAAVGFLKDADAMHCAGKAG